MAEACRAHWSNPLRHPVAGWIGLLWMLFQYIGYRHTGQGLQDGIFVAGILDRNERVAALCRLDGRRAWPRCRRHRPGSFWPGWLRDGITEFIHPVHMRLQHGRLFWVQSLDLLQRGLFMRLARGRRDANAKAAMCARIC